MALPDFAFAGEVARRKVGEPAEEEKEVVEGAVAGCVGEMSTN